MHISVYIVLVEPACRVWRGSIYEKHALSPPLQHLASPSPSPSGRLHLLSLARPRLPPSLPFSACSLNNFLPNDISDDIVALPSAPNLSSQSRQNCAMAVALIVTKITKIQV